jgi:hypothetical protein
MVNIYLIVDIFVSDANKITKPLINLIDLKCARVSKVGPVIFFIYRPF